MTPCRKPLLPISLLAIAILTPAGIHAQWRTPWSYQGPAGSKHWGDLDPEYATCKSGKAQSPIDIRGAQKVSLPALRFEFHAAPLKYLINNGKTIRVNYHDAPEKGNALIVDGKRYQLTQFHFHRPSEEYINGKPYDMVIHFMLDAAPGQTAGVAVLLKSGKANATIQQIWAHMPKTEGTEQEIPGVEIDPSGLLPHQLGYYMYMGSVSAPPCTEGVTWYVLKTPVELSPSQINRFAELYPQDVRSIQPLNGRIVKESR